jgi:hypothetical protein
MVIYPCSQIFERKGGFMNKLQLESVFSLLYRSEKHRQEKHPLGEEEKYYLTCIKKLKSEDESVRMLPKEVAEVIFPAELALSVVDDLGKEFGDGVISVDEAVRILGETLDEICEDAENQKTEENGVT